MKGATTLKTFRFDPGLGRQVETYGSNFEISGLALPKQDLQISCMRLGAGGLVGSHPATLPQLFIVVEGEGWVESQDQERVAISAGGAAFWNTGEIHSAGTDSNLTAIVVECSLLDPSQIPAFEDSTNNPSLSGT